MFWTINTRNFNTNLLEMKKVIFYTVRVISIALLLVPAICALPGFLLMILADELTEDPYLK